MDVEFKDRTIASLLPGADKSEIHSQWRMSGTSESATVPGNGEPGELLLSVGKMERYGNTLPEKDG